MEVVRQLSQDDCGVAVLAMVAEIPYDEVVRRIGLPQGRGLQVKEMLDALRRLTWAEWEVVVTPLPAVVICRLFDIERHKVVVGVLWKRRDSKWGHWVCVHDNRVYDPEFNSVFHLANYPRQDWLVRLILRRKREPGKIYSAPTATPRG